MKIRFMSIGSGSCGNCYFLSGDNGAILIEAGVSLRRLKKFLLQSLNNNITGNSYYK